MSIDDLLGPAFRKHLARKQFIEVAPKNWVRSTKLPMREIVRTRAYKGATYSIGWGIGLDFAPYMTNDGSFRWKRTAKSARPDLAIWPEDDTRSSPSWNEFCYLPGLWDPTSEEIDQLIGKVARAADAFFMSVATIEDLVSAFEVHDKVERRVPAWFYPQHMLGWAFALCYLGRHDESDAMLERFRLRINRNCDEVFLKRALTAAGPVAAFVEAEGSNGD